MTPLETARKLLAGKELYLLTSDYTKVAYVVCDPETFDDEVFLFDSEEGAKKAQEEWQEKGEAVSIRKVEAKEYLNVFLEFMLEGVNTVVVSSKGKPVSVPLGELIKKKPEKEQPKGKKLAENPALCISLIYYLQEARKGGEIKDLKRLSEMEEEVLHHLAAGQFLMPAQAQEGGEQTAGRMMLLKISNGDTAFPLFTDTIAFGKTAPAAKTLLFPADLKKLVTGKLPDEIKGVMINPGSFSFYLPFAILRKALENYGEL